MTNIEYIRATNSWKKELFIPVRYGDKPLPVSVACVSYGRLIQFYKIL